jgi:hypothetical protein
MHHTQSSLPSSLASLPAFVPVLRTSSPQSSAFMPIVAVPSQNKAIHPSLASMRHTPSQRLQRFPTLMPSLPSDASDASASSWEKVIARVADDASVFSITNDDAIDCPLTVDQPMLIKGDRNYLLLTPEESSVLKSAICHEANLAEKKASSGVVFLAVKKGDALGDVQKKITAAIGAQWSPNDWEILSQSWQNTKTQTTQAQLIDITDIRDQMTQRGIQSALRRLEPQLALKLISWVMHQKGWSNNVSIMSQMHAENLFRRLGFKNTIELSTQTPELLPKERLYPSDRPFAQSIIEIGDIDQQHQHAIEQVRNQYTQTHFPLLSQEDIDASDAQVQRNYAKLLDTNAQLSLIGPEVLQSWNHIQHSPLNEPLIQVQAGTSREAMKSFLQSLFGDLIGGYQIDQFLAKAEIKNTAHQMVSLAPLMDAALKKLFQELKIDPSMKTLSDIQENVLHHEFSLYDANFYELLSQFAQCESHPIVHDLIKKHGNPEIFLAAPHYIQALALAARIRPNTVTQETFLRHLNTPEKQMAFVKLATLCADKEDWSLIELEKDPPSFT